ncbi:hypothetical protein ACH5RR_009231 [Cinchona calisaya]|uniref:NAC domain-containing protein n=1 Tax=Cinchona calisaya TaxID=153742 RepID=A0ABD3AFD1_9GENT
MVFPHEEFASTPTMEIQQQNKAIGGASGSTSPNTYQIPPSINQQEPLVAASINNTSSHDNHPFTNEFFEEDELPDREFFESFPPGYRFCPKDSELIICYLKKKIDKQTLPRNQIKHVNLYQYSPDKISGWYRPIGENEWYFFTPRERKYRNGTRPNRAAGSGYWKATGADKPVKNNGLLVGYRKALVFYEGKPPKGVKTNWIMHEYRVNEPSRPKTNDADMRLDDFVLCRIYKKTDKSFKSRQHNEDPEDDYPTPQGSEIFDQNNAYASDMDAKNDLGGIDPREFSAIEASAGFDQFQFPSGFPQVPFMVDPPLINSVKYFFHNQQPLNHEAKPVDYRPPMYSTGNAFMQKYLRENMLDVKPEEIQENMWSMNEDFNLSHEYPISDMDSFQDTDHFIDNPPPTSSFQNTNNQFYSPPMPK